MQPGTNATLCGTRCDLWATNRQLRYICDPEQIAYSRWYLERIIQQQSIIAFFFLRNMYNANVCPLPSNRTVLYLRHNPGMSNKAYANLCRKSALIAKHVNAIPPHLIIAPGSAKTGKSEDVFVRSTLYSAVWFSFVPRFYFMALRWTPVNETRRISPGTLWNSLIKENKKHT